MKRLLLFSVISLSLYGAGPTIYMAPPASKPTAKQTTKKPLPQKSPSKIEKSVAATTIASKGPTEMMIISPEGRAQDIKAAIQFLKKQTPSSKPAIQLTNGTILSGIIDVDVMPGGTLLIFKVTSLKGMKYLIEKIEHIDTIVTDGS